jgi:putative phosphoribosyl transferase
MTGPLLGTSFSAGRFLQILTEAITPYDLTLRGDGDCRIVLQRFRKFRSYGQRGKVFSGQCKKCHESQHPVIRITATLRFHAQNSLRGVVKVIFLDRAEAGRVLARHLHAYENRSDVIVLGIPRGGVPVAFEVAAKLHVALDVIIVRKLGVPGHVELGFGAIASGGLRFLDVSIVQAVGVSNEAIEKVTAMETQELERRESAYRGGRGPLNVAGKTAILVDDGIATGSSMQVAIRALREWKVARLVVAVPVAPVSTCRRLKTQVDDLVCAQTPTFFQTIGAFYENFLPVSDEEVRDLLQRSAQTPARSPA